MKKLVITVAIVCFVVLNCMAISDIVKGNEINYSLQYSLVVGSAVIFGFLVVYIIQKFFPKTSV